MKKFSYLLSIYMAVYGFLVACDEKKTKLQYLPDMADAPTVKPQEDYLNPPEGAVSVTSVPYGTTPEENAQFMTNPLPATETTIKQGQKLFETFCIPCHGIDGKGQGSITDEFPPPPDITSAMYKDKPDSFFFYRISVGGVLMPSYGYATDLRERWMIVNYLRQLQGAKK